MKKQKKKNQNPSHSRSNDEVRHQMVRIATEIGTDSKIRKLFELVESKFPKGSLTFDGLCTQLFKAAVHNGCVTEYQTVKQYYDKLPQKTLSEQETRAVIIKNARGMGIDAKFVIAIFDKYDNLLKTATTEAERQQISFMGGAELHRLLSVRGPLIMDGVELIPGDENALTKESKIKLV